MDPTLQLNNQQSSLRVFVEVEQEGGRVTRIGAVLYDGAAGHEVAVFDRPVNVGEAEDFAAAIRAFERFCVGYPIWTFDDTQRKLKGESRYYSVEFPFRRPFIRVKSLLSSWGVRPSRYAAGMLYEVAGLKLASSASGVLHDVRSVAATVSFFENLDLL